MILGRRTPVTTFLLLAIVAVFVVETVRGGADDPRVLIAMGADHPLLVRQGQYWRLVTSLFLHASFVHIFVNGWALYQLGSLFELILGSGRLLVVYFVSGIAGSIASTLFTRSLSVGASGAIFGVMGALIAFLLKRRENLTPQAKSLLMQLLLWAGINVFLGFSIQFIDNAAHLGGCAAGFAIGLFLQDRPRYRLAPAPDGNPAGLP